MSMNFGLIKKVMSGGTGTVTGRVKDYANVITVSPSGGADYTDLATAVGALSNDNTLIMLFPGTWTVSSTINSTTSNGYDINIMAMNSHVSYYAVSETIISANMNSYIFDTTGIDIKIFNCKLQNIDDSVPPEGKIAAGTGTIFLTGCYSEGSFATRMTAMDSVFQPHSGSGEGVIDQSNIARSDFVRCNIGLKINCNDTSAVLRFLEFTDTRMNHSIDLNNTIYRRRILCYGNNYISNVINVNAASTSEIRVYGVVGAGSVFDTDLVIIKTSGAGLILQKLADNLDANGKKINNLAGANSSDDIEITDSTKGVILKSPDSSRWRLTLDNNGVITSTKLI